MNTPEQFNAAWLAAQSLETQVEMNRTAPMSSERLSAMANLKAHGVIIDYEIMIDGYDPYKVMFARFVYGYTWVNSWGQDNIPVPPGFTFPGLRSYDPLQPPTGSIPVYDPDTCDLAKVYTSAIKPLPVPVVAAPTGPFVGDRWAEADSIASFVAGRPVQAFKALPAAGGLADGLPNGATIESGGKQFTKAFYQNIATALVFFYQS